jgi:hypothetical protein
MTRELLESGEQFRRNPAGAKFSKELLVIDSDDLAVDDCALDRERIDVLLLAGGNGDIFGRKCFSLERRWLWAFVVYIVNIADILRRR